MLDVIFLYLSQKFEWNNLRDKLEEWIEEDRSVAVIGDMNIDYLGKNHDFIKYMQIKNFVQLVDKPTHKYGGLLDHIYVNQSLMKKKPFYTQRSIMHSDHDIIVLHLPKNV